MNKEPAGPGKSELELALKPRLRAAGLAWIIALLHAFLPGAWAGVIVNDPFTDGMRTNTSGGDIQGLVYYASGGTAGWLVVTNDSAGIGSSNALLLNSLATYGHGLGYFAGVQLTNSGDTLQLNMDFRFGSAAPNNTWAAFRVGFYDSRLTRMTADGSTTPGYDDVGYGCFLSNPALAGSNLSVYSESAGINDDILGGPSPSGLVAAGGTGTSPGCGTSKHTLFLQITRLLSGDLSVRAAVDAGTGAQATISAASVLTYTFDEFGFGRGNTNTPIFVDNILISYTAATNVGAEAFVTLRQKWFDYLTGGTNLDLSDATTRNALTSITNNANNYWSSLNKSPSRTYLWSDAASTTVSAHITTCFNRLNSMALGWAVTGSMLYSNASLQADILSALDWMNTNRYNATNSKYGNWWDWEIGSPMALDDICVLMFKVVSPAQLSNYMAAVDKFTPVPSMSGANLVWKSRVVGVRGALVQDAGKLTLTRDAFSQVFPYVTRSDGFYTDGSFIQHTRHPYTGGYGSALLANLSPLLPWLKGSPWEITDPQQTNIANWVFNSFEPVLYRGACLDMVRGREISRSGSPDHGTGNGIMQSILRISQFAAPADAARMRSLVKELALEDTSRSFVAGCPLSLMPVGEQLMADTNTLPRGELVAHFQFPCMDRVVHLRPGFGVALSLFSTRIYDYESINGENLHNWFTGSGMTYLYNADLSNYSDSFWCTVNPYRLAGTTVPRTSRANSYGQSQVSAFDWVGGASLDDSYGAVGMELGTYGGTLTARKSWFCFDDEIVALGAAISSGDVTNIETTAENRMLTAAGTNVFTVDGVVQSATMGWSNGFTGLSWAHLAGDVAGADIGYFFPQPVTVQALREARTGSWSQINTNGSTNSVTRNYLTLWFDHGTKPTNATYAYTLLPNKSAAEVAAYAGNPDIDVVENSALAQAVREKRLGLFAANFWTAGPKTADFVTCNNKASFISRETLDDLKVAVSDPTQTNTGSLTLTLNRAAVALAYADPGVNVTQLNPVIQMTVSTSGRKGQPATARFLYYTNSPPILTPVSNRVTMAGVALSVTNHAVDPGLAPQTLAFTLPNAPPGASIDQRNGVVSWRPGIALAGTSNQFTVVVSESGWHTNLASIADAYVRDGSYASSNFGSDANLTVKLSSSSLTRESYLKFTLPPLHGSVSDAQLRLVPTSVSFPGTHSIAVVSNTSWSETGLTWNNKPVSGPPLASWLPAASTPVLAPVTAVAQAAQAGDPVLSVRVYAQNSTADGYVTYGARESAASAPALLVTATNGTALSATQSFWVVVAPAPAPALAGCGVTNGTGFLTLNGVSGPDYLIEASSNLLSWAMVFATNSPPLPFVWFDPDTNAPPERFYRVRLGP